MVGLEIVGAAVGDAVNNTSGKSEIDRSSSVSSVALCCLDCSS